MSRTLILLSLLVASACAHGTRASGSFDVKITPGAAGGTFGAMSVAKAYHGGVEGSGTGEMLAWGTGQKTGTIVGLERVTGSVDGRKGTFVLAHKGSMVGGQPQMTVTVAPDSGTDELTGLRGAMTIHISDGKHTYDFDYALP